MCICVSVCEVLDDQILIRLFWNVNFLVKLSLNHKLGKNKISFFGFADKTSLKLKKKKESSISF